MIKEDRSGLGSEEKVLRVQSRSPGQVPVLDSSGFSALDKSFTLIVSFWSGTVSSQCFSSGGAESFCLSS